MSNLTLDRLPGRVLEKLDLETVFQASRCVIAAERFHIFRKLDGRELTSAEVGRRTGISREYCESFLDFLVFLGLLKKRDNLYRNSALASRYLVRQRSIRGTELWSRYCAEDYAALSVLEDVLSRGKNWQQILGRKRKRDYELLREDPDWARDFTYLLYDMHKSDADILAKNLDLSDYHSLLDIGGGSGVMSIALVRAHPHLKACILDFEFVCETARRIIRSESLSRRIKTLVGDMSRAIPGGFDVVMFWDIGHIDTRVMKMAYDSMPDGGMIVRSCTPPPRTKRPSPAVFMRHYLSIMPKSQTKAGKIDSLREVGFKNIKYRRINQDLGLITACKR